MLDNLMTGLALMASVESFIAILIGLLAGIIIGFDCGYCDHPVPADYIQYGTDPGDASAAWLVVRRHIRRLHYCNFDQYTGYALERSDCAGWLSADAAGQAAEGSDDGAVCLVFRWPVQCAGIAVCCTEHCTFHTDVWPSGVFLHRSVWLVYYCKHLERQYHQGSARRPDRHFHCTAGTGFGQRYTSVYLWCPSAGRRYPADRYAGRSVRNCRIAQPLGL